MERTNLIPGTEVCFYDGGIPRKGETLLGTALTEYEHGDRWKVRKAKIVGSPVRRRGQWHVEVEWASASMPENPHRVSVPARQLVCQWDVFVDTLSLRKVHNRKVREEELAAIEAKAKREEAIEKALEERGLDSSEVYFPGETVKLPLALMEALLGIG